MQSAYGATRLPRPLASEPAAGELQTPPPDRGSRVITLVKMMQQSEDGQMKDMVGVVGEVGVRTGIRRAGALAGETGRLEPLRHQMICPD